MKRVALYKKGFLRVCKLVNMETINGEKLIEIRSQRPTRLTPEEFREIVSIVEEHLAPPGFTSAVSYGAPR